MIDEAQVLTDELLKEIRLLANFDLNGQSLIRIFLAGQPELRKKLVRPENKAFAQRITLNYHIDPLLPEETREYIQYRLQVAGTSRPIFSSEAVQRVHRYSSGVPRQINILCDHALLTGYVEIIHRFPVKSLMNAPENCPSPAFLIRTRPAVTAGRLPRWKLPAKFPVPFLKAALTRRPIPVKVSMSDGPLTRARRLMWIDRPDMDRLPDMAGHPTLLRLLSEKPQPPGLFKTKASDRI